MMMEVEISDEMPGIFPRLNIGLSLPNFDTPSFIVLHIFPNPPQSLSLRDFEMRKKIWMFAFESFVSDFAMDKKKIIF